METIDDLVADSLALIADYQNPQDHEALYNRIWHCLRWQQHDQDERLIPLIARLYDLFVRVVPVEQRRMMFLAAKDAVANRQFSPSVLMNFMSNEIDEGLASSATIDLLAYSKRDFSSLPVGFRALMDIIENAYCRLPGALFGAAVSFGDGDLSLGLDAMAAHLTDRDFGMAARMQTGYANHASIQYWMSIARRLAVREDQVAQSIVGSAASALVRIRQSAIHPIVFDIERLYPAWDHHPPTTIKQSWNLEEYGLVIRSHLLEIYQLEAGPKIFDQVINCWCASPFEPISSQREFGTSS